MSGEGSWSADALFGAFGPVLGRPVQIPRFDTHRSSAQLLEYNKLVNQACLAISAVDLDLHRFSTTGSGSRRVKSEEILCFKVLDVED
jgi:hypothetical protein